jgi:hypothetical protein
MGASLPFGGYVNQSTFVLLRDSLRRLNRTRLLRSQAKLFCSECKALRQVTDYFVSGEALLDCGHRRPAFFLDTKVAKELQSEVEARTVRREVCGYAAPTAGGFIRTFEEDIEVTEEIAA